MEIRTFIYLKPLHERYHLDGLSIEGVSLHKIMEKYNTPLYVTSLTAILNRGRCYQKNMTKFFPNYHIFYAVKANTNNVLLTELNHLGIGVDIVSLGEWNAARKAGFHPQNISYAGVCKKQEDWQIAITENIGFVSVEHLDELSDILNFIFNKRKLGQHFNTQICLRLNPCLHIQTHPHLITGALNSKFGILFSHFKNWFFEKKQQQHEHFKQWIAPLTGLHVHVGSQLQIKDIYSVLFEEILLCADFLREQNVHITHLNCGGGLAVANEGVPHDGSDIENYISTLAMEFKKKLHNFSMLQSFWRKDFSRLHFALEPGRSLVASSTVFLTQILYTKINSEEHRFCYVDGGMNDFPRPAIYDAYHHVEPINFIDEHTISMQGHKSREVKHWNIVGPICESSDILAKNRLLPTMQRRELLAFFEAGAYCQSMASQYNSRALPKSIFIKNKKII